MSFFLVRFVANRRNMSPCLKFCLAMVLFNTVQCKLKSLAPILCGLPVLLMRISICYLFEDLIPWDNFFSPNREIRSREICLFHFHEVTFARKQATVKQLESVLSCWPWTTRYIFFLLNDQSIILKPSMKEDDGLNIRMFYASIATLNYRIMSPADGRGQVICKQTHR